MEATQHYPHTSTSNSGKITVPFYAPPSYCKKTSAEIINEARASINSGNSTNISISSLRMAASIRPVDTKRPFTPRDPRRLLFGSSRKTRYRPPSSFSLDYLQFQEQESGNVSPRIRRLNPITSSTPSSPISNTVNGNCQSWKMINESKSYNDLNDEALISSLGGISRIDIQTLHNKLKLPSIHNTGISSNRRNPFRTTVSLDNLPEEIESDNAETSQLESVSCSEKRKAYSSPVERTKSVLDIEFQTDVQHEQSSDDQNLSAIEQNKFTNKFFTKENKFKSHRNNIAWENEQAIIMARDTSKETAVSGKNSKSTSCDEIIQNCDNVNIKDDVTRKIFLSNFHQSLETMTLHPKVECMESVSTESVKLSEDVYNDGGNFNNSETSDNNFDRENKKYKKIKLSGRHNVQSPKNLSKIKLPSPSRKPSEGTDIIESMEENYVECHRENSSNNNKNFVNLHNDESDVKVKNSQTEKHNGLDLASNTSTEYFGSHETSQRILELLFSLSNKGSGADDITCILSRLYTALETEGHIGPSVQNSKVKSQVLKVLYRFVETPDERLLLEISKIMLGMRVNGNNLSAVCKLIFKISKNDFNDKLFLDGKILELFVEAIGSASPLEDAEACIYGYGALKFLTMNNVLLKKILNLGILELMVLHMKMVNNARIEGAYIPEQMSHALFQLTGVLRNVAGEEEIFPQFVMTGAVTQLCNAMKYFSSDLDVISNVSRTLSIISTHDACSHAIVDYECSFHLFVKLFQKYPGRQDIVVRLGYAVGNLMAKSDDARKKFYNERGAVDTMLNLLKIYLDKDLKIINNPNVYESRTSDNGSSGSVEDVIVKIIRILANMSINPEVGVSLASSLFSDSYVSEESEDINATSDAGIDLFSSKERNKFLDILLTILHRKSVVESEEMIHSVLSTLNNLSYYSAEDSSINERQLEISEVLYSLLCNKNKKCLVEVTQVFGNLTRFKDTRDFLLDNGGMNLLLEFLNEDDKELLCSTTGILVNMMADWDKRLAFSASKGIERLNNILLKCEGDWPLCTLICQVLWNYCTESSNLLEAFDDEEMNQLMLTLADFLDDERLFGVKEGTEIDEIIANSEYYQLWEEFAGVATNLLEKIEIFLNPLEPLEPLELISTSDDSTLKSQDNIHVSSANQSNFASHSPVSNTVYHSEDKQDSQQPLHFSNG